MDVPIVSNQQCQSQMQQTRLGYDFKLHPGFLCAGGEEGKDACKVRTFFNQNYLSNREHHRFQSAWCQAQLPPALLPPQEKRSRDLERAEIVLNA